MVELNEKAFTQYRRKQIAELRPWREGDDMAGISVSQEDAKAGSPKPGDMIARNPKNHADQWLVAAAYFADNFEPVSTLPAPDDGLVERLNRWHWETANQWSDEYSPRPSWEKQVSVAMKEWAKASDEAATALQSKDEQIERLTRERDEALEAEGEAQDSFWAIYPDWVKLKGHGISTEAARTMLTKRAEAAEQQVQKLTAENERLREALEAAAIALDEAAIEVHDWGEYAGEYVQDKHDLEGCCDEIAKQARTARSALTQEGER